MATPREARYVIKLEGDALVYVVNQDVRFGPPEVMARISSGEIVDPPLVYFRIVPRFKTASPSYQ